MFIISYPYSKTKYINMSDQEIIWLILVVETRIFN